jgi:hypothetical protein
MSEKNLYSKNININKSKRLVFELEDESENNSDDELEKEFELQVNKKIPINYGSKWTDKDKNELIKLLKNIKKEKETDSEKNKIISYDNELELKKTLILEIGNKLGRTEGGIVSEVKKIIFNMYMNGDNAENISNELNLTFKAVKSIIKIFIDKECEQEIKSLEKENKLLRLKIENYNLRIELKKINLQK